MARGREEGEAAGGRRRRRRDCMVVAVVAYSLYFRSFVCFLPVLLVRVE
jgi:hypothetical protein